MPTYSLKDFGGCLYNPLLPDLLEKHPQLNELVIEPKYSVSETGELEVTEDERIGKLRDEYFIDKKEQLVRYVLMVYDPMSPITRDIKDVAKRKSAAAELAGFEPDEENIESLFDGSCRVAFEAVFLFLKDFVRDMEWALVCALEFKFWEGIKLMLQPISNGSDKEQLDALQKKKIISDGFGTDIERIRDSYKTFFGEDEKIEETFQKVRFNSESVANVFKDRKR